MKRTKNLFATSITLIIVLFASVQVTAMEQQDPVITQVKNQIKEYQDTITWEEQKLNPKSTIWTSEDKRKAQEIIAYYREKIENLEAMMEQVKQMEDYYRHR